MDRDSLVREIERVRVDVVEGLAADMYQNPFWESRYGERGRRFTDQDTNYHLNYLIAAIQLNNPPSLITYYHWLQGLLVYRGMCTLHIQQTIDSLGRQLAHLLPESWPMIEKVHRVSYEGLTYGHPASQQLYLNLDRIARSTAERIFAPSAGDDPNDLEQRKAACYQDTLYFLSYLADMVAYQVQDGFQKYIDWLKSFRTAQQVPLEPLYANLQVLTDEITRVLGPENAAPFTTILANSLLAS